MSRHTQSSLISWSRHFRRKIWFIFFPYCKVVLIFSAKRIHIHLRIVEKGVFLSQCRPSSWCWSFSLLSVISQSPFLTWHNAFTIDWNSCSPHYVKTAFCRLRVLCVSVRLPKRNWFTQVGMATDDFCTSFTLLLLFSTFAWIPSN